VEKEISSSDLILVEFPYLFDYAYEVARSVKRKIPIVLSEHNVEYLMDKILTFSYPSRRFFLSMIKKMEEFAVNNANMIFSVSEGDAESLRNIYNPEVEIKIIPNGVDTNRFNIISQNEKSKLKEQFNLSNKRVVLFSGSSYKPNMEAVKRIMEMAKKIKNNNIIFLITGSVGKGLKSTRNVIFTGYVDDILPYFKMADIAINPLDSGSGTNLKMLEYLASGLPTVATEVGARGLEVEHEKNIIIVDLEEFPKRILDLLEDEKLSKKLAIYGRKLTEETYDWKKLSDKAVKNLETLSG
jgi:glycosyltransferase involved in cell wall biosynthesis